MPKKPTIKWKEWLKEHKIVKDWLNDVSNDTTRRNYKYWIKKFFDFVENVEEYETNEFFEMLQDEIQLREMKITVYKKIYGFRSVSKEPIEIDCNGEGTEKNPAILEPTESLPDILCIIDSNIFLKFTKCKIKTLEFTNSEHISIENCSIKSMRAFHCVDISLKDSIIENSSWFHHCQKFNMERCRFEDKLEIVDFHNCYMKNCYFERIKNSLSSNNIFENCDLDEKDMINLISKTSGLKNAETFLYLSMLVILFFSIMYGFFWTSIPLFFLYSLIFIFILLILVLFKQQLKIKNNKSQPPNIIK